MFIGEFLCKVDIKNRIYIPKAFRKICAEFVITILDRDTLLVNKKDGWSASKILSVLENSDVDLKTCTKYINSHSFIVSLDSEGRIVIPKRFMEMLSFKGEAIVLGTSDGFSILNKERYYSELEDVNRKFGDFLVTEDGEEFRRALIYQ